jgi:hypothetical protein
VNRAGGEQTEDVHVRKDQGEDPDVPLDIGKTTVYPMVDMVHSPCQHVEKESLVASFLCSNSSYSAVDLVIGKESTDATSISQLCSAYH